MPEPVLLHEYLVRAARHAPDKTALVCGETRWTYADLDRRSDALAAWLLRQGFRRGDRVAILLDNSAESVATVYGVLKAGGVFVNIGATAKESKLRFVLRDSDARFLITHTVKGRVVEPTLGRAEDETRILWVGDPARIPSSLADRSEAWSEATEPRDAAPLVVEPTIDCDLASILYTSGSTGDPKGVMGTHGSMVSAARSIVQYLGNTESDVVLDVLPLSFGYGLYQVLASVISGGTVVIEKSFLFLHPIMERIASECVTGFPMVPSVAAMMLRLKDIQRYDLSSLRYITNAGAGIPVEHLLELRRLAPRCKIFPMYGLTECTRVCYLDPEEVDRRPDSVGKAMPNCKVRILNDEGQPVAPGEVGELAVRGANVSKGYWKAPEATAMTFKVGEYPHDRWLMSGDLFRRDEEGFLYFVSRKDNLIKSGGEKVGPREVENAICEIKGVVESAVVGVPDDILGQAVKAFVVRNNEASPTERDVKKQCARRLEAHMVPKLVEFIDQLPKTPNGKVNKRALRAME